LLTAPTGDSPYSTYVQEFGLFDPGAQTGGSSQIPPQKKKFRPDAQIKIK
jgi:hypothetical protein